MRYVYVSSAPNTVLSNKSEMMQKVIKTSRLILRPFRTEDIQPAYEMNLDAEITRYTGDGGVVSRAETERRIKEDVLGDYAKHGYGRMAVELISENKFIGFCGLKYLEDLQEVDLGYRLMTKYWGQGLATEAARACVQYGFEELNVLNMIAFVLPENIGSVRVLEKLGFQYEKEVEEDGILAKLYRLEKKCFTKKVNEMKHKNP